MNILQRYIAKTIFQATGLAVLIIVGVLSLMMMLAEMKNIGVGDYGFTQSVLYVLMRMPNELYQFSPMLMLLGSIIGVSMLASHKELAVMRTAGVSLNKIIISVLSAVFTLTLITSVIGEWVAPNLSYRAETYKENAKNAGLAVVTASGVWLHVENNFIHIKHVVGRQLLEGITRYQFDDQHRLQAAYYANTLTLQNHEWKMIDVLKTSFHHDRTSSKSFAELPWNLKINPNLLNVGLVEPHEMSLPRLAKFSRYLKQNSLQATAYEYEFWQRVLQPIAAILMIFLAIPFVLSTLSAATLGWRILAGILTGFAFFIINATLGQLCVVYQLPTSAAALLPIMLFAILGFFMSRRVMR